MGIELLAPRAIPIAVRMLQKKGNNTDYHRAVLLPALEAIGQPAMLITPRLPYQRIAKGAAAPPRHPGDRTADAPGTDDRKFYPVHIPNAGWLLGKHPDRPEHGLAVGHDRCRPFRAAPKRASDRAREREEVGKLSNNRDCDEVWPRRLRSVYSLPIDPRIARMSSTPCCAMPASRPVPNSAATSPTIPSPSNPSICVVCRSGFDHLERVLPALRKRKPDLPIIVMDDSSEPKNLTRGLAIGATDVVFDDDNERLLYVVKRELENVCQRHRFSQTRRALQEAERRCELLLANSTAAIAYVHEGMHIYANDDYFKLFGFADADELLGVPLLDLMDGAFADEFKAKIKSFREDSSEELSFSFEGRSTSGEPITGQMTLTGAEYEGEHCTQVLVRSERRARAAGPPAAHAKTKPRDQTPDSTPSAVRTCSWLTERRDQFHSDARVHREIDTRRRRDPARC